MRVAFMDFLIVLEPSNLDFRRPLDFALKACRVTWGQ